MGIHRPCDSKTISESGLSVYIHRPREGGRVCRQEGRSSCDGQIIRAHIDVWS